MIYSISTTNLLYTYMLYMLYIFYIHYKIGIYIGVHIYIYIKSLSSVKVLIQGTGL